MTTEQSNIVSIDNSGEVTSSNYSISEPRVISMQPETKTVPSKISLFKAIANEYLRFLIDPTFVVGHIVKIAICLGLLFYMLPDNIMKDIIEIKKILQCILIAAVGFQIVTSSLRSMLLPIVSITVAVIADVILKSHGLSVPFNPVAFQYLLATGVLGIGVAVFFRPSV